MEVLSPEILEVMGTQSTAGGTRRCPRGGGRLGLVLTLALSACGERPPEAPRLEADPRAPAASDPAEHAAAAEGGLAGGREAAEAEATAAMPRRGAAGEPPPMGPSAPPRYEREDGLAASGRVVDASGRPVAGARVLPRAWVVSTGFPARSLDGPTTDAGGRYRVAGLDAESRHVLLALHDEHPIGWVAWNPALDEPAEGVDVRLPGEKAVRGRVLDEQGRPSAGAKVLAAGSYRVSASKGSRSSPPVDVVLEEGRRHEARLALSGQ